MIHFTRYIVNAVAFDHVAVAASAAHTSDFNRVTCAACLSIRGTEVEADRLMERESAAAWTAQQILLNRLGVL